MKRVLVTGVSGFLGHHCALELLKNGYHVRGSVRDLNKKVMMAGKMLLKVVNMFYMLLRPFLLKNQKMKMNILNLYVMEPCAP